MAVLQLAGPCQAMISVQPEPGVAPVHQTNMASEKPEAKSFTEKGFVDGKPACARVPLPPLTVIGAPNGLLLLEIVSDPAGEDALEALAQAVGQMDTEVQGNRDLPDTDDLFGLQEGEDAKHVKQRGHRVSGRLGEGEASDNSNEGTTWDGTAAAAWREALHELTEEPQGVPDEHPDSRTGASWGSMGWRPSLGNSGLDLGRDWRQRVQV
jgi:hypothetical protein